MYAKVFTQIFDSSIADNYLLRHFFMDLLVLCDSEGVIDMTQEAISARTRIPIDDVRAMLLELEKPDPRSRTPKENGSRLARLSKHRDWGWRVVNYKSYRDIRDENGRKHYMRDYMRKYRWDKVSCKHDVNTRKQALTGVDHGKPMQKQKQKQKQIQKDTKSVFTKPEFAELELHASKIGLPALEITKFQNHYEANGWRVGRNVMRSWKHAMQNWKINYDTGKYQNHGRAGVPGANRNAGTLNEGHTEQYDLSKIQGKSGV